MATKPAPKKTVAKKASIKKPAPKKTATKKLATKKASTKKVATPTAARPSTPLASVDSIAETVVRFADTVGDTASARVEAAVAFARTAASTSLYTSIGLPFAAQARVAARPAIDFTNVDLRKLDVRAFDLDAVKSVVAQFPGIDLGSLRGLLADAKHEGKARVDEFQANAERFAKPVVAPVRRLADETVKRALALVAA